MMKAQRFHVVRLLVLVIAMILAIAAAQAAAKEKGKAKAKAQSSAESAAPLASIQLYNQTAWTGQTPVEVPTGRLAAPGLIDWANVHLALDGKEVPFAIREGRVHWKAKLTAPIEQPRAEDLLVFPIAVPQGQWVRVDVLPGKPADDPSALKREDGACIVSYGDLKATVNESTGMLTGLETAGSALLEAPLGVDFYTVAAGTIEQSGEVGPAYDQLNVKIKKDTKLAPAKARLVSSSSTPALTELNFIIEPAQGPALGLTYRIYASGCVEIWSNERPWQGTSPWISFAVEHSLKLAGTAEAMRYQQNRTQYYAFKDYSAVVKLAGTIHHAPKADVIEFGEHTINGRRWVRQLYINKQAEPATTQVLAEMISEGLIVSVDPVTAPLGQSAVQVACPESSKAAAEILVKALKEAGIEAEIGAKSAVGDVAGRVSFKLADASGLDGLEGDGFSIRLNAGGKGVTIQSATRFGLVQGAYKVTDYLRRNPQARALPLIASNPAVDLRSGGFGGGNHEVDFPYGPEAEWEQAFDGLIASGMNKLTCLGMWGNWKLPASFKYMPELRSNAPDAYDEVSGAKFVEFDMHREKGQRLIKYLHDRGAKVWLWIPVGCVPTTFAQKYPEAMVAGSKKTPRFMHPKYREYLDAFFKEILETYPLDGFMLIRDDNGGVDDSPEYKQYLETSRTKNPTWEQYLLIYDLLRKKGFQETIMVYPYCDPYEPRLDPLMPQDLLIGGHGSGMAMLTCNYEKFGPMGDTWLDNLYTSFRVPPAPRIKRLIGDRGSYWIGGAYCGTELPWEAPGYFGWEPTASVNTFRYDWGMRKFSSQAKAVAFASFSNAYESLWEIYNDDLLPYTWQLKMTAAERAKTSETGRQLLEVYKTRLSKLQSLVGTQKKQAVKANNNSSVPANAIIVRQDGSGPGGHKTIDAAVKATGGTGVVVVDDNAVYEENFGIELAKGWNVAIKAGEGKTPVLRCVKKDNGWYNVFIYLATNGTLTVDGFNIVGTSGKTLSGGFMNVAGDGSGSDVTIKNCIVTGDWGDIINVGGAMGDASNSKLHLIGNRMYLRNHRGVINAQEGGLGKKLVATIDRCTIVQDPAFDAGHAIGFLYGDIPTDKPAYHITNSIFLDTTQLIYMAQGASLPFEVTMEYSLYSFSSCNQFITVKNCKADNPMLKNAAALDFTLLPASSAIGAGSGIDGAKNAGWDQLTTLDPNARWLTTVSLYGTFFEYSLRRAELHMQLFDLMTPHKADVQAGKSLPADVRQKVIDTYKALYASSDAFTTQTARTPGDMLRSTELTTRPYKEWLGGFNGDLEQKLDFKQFAGTMTVSPTQVAAAKPIELKVELCNKGVCPWIPGVAHKLLLEGDFKKLGLPEITDFAGEWVLPGEKRVITLIGKAPEGAGQGEVKISFMSPFYLTSVVTSQGVTIAWK